MQPAGRLQTAGELSPPPVKQVSGKITAEICETANFQQDIGLRKLANSLRRDAGAEQISVSPDVVDPTDSRPELALPRPRSGISRLLTRIGMGPVVGTDTGCRVRRVFERII